MSPASQCGQGGTSTAGGAAGIWNNNGNPGTKLQGGGGNTCPGGGVPGDNDCAGYGSGGGGAGYYGGGSGGTISQFNGGRWAQGGGSGGGGSNWVSSNVNLTVIQPGTNSAPGGINEPNYPNPNPSYIGYGSTTAFNSGLGGNGYVVITLS